MVVAPYNKFDIFVEDLGKAVHNLISTQDALKCYASNTAPASTNTVKTDIPEIASQNGYPAGGTDIQNDYSQTGGTATLTGTSFTWTSTGAGFGPLRYIILYNDTQTSPIDPLIAWWDHGSSVSPSGGQTFTVQFGASVFTLT